MMVLVGVVMLSVPIYYHFHGQSKTDELTQQFEEIMEEKANEEAESEEEKGNNTEATLSEDDAAIFAEGEVIAILEIEYILFLKIKIRLARYLLESCALKRIWNTGKAF